MRGKNQLGPADVLFGCFDLETLLETVTHNVELSEAQTVVEVKQAIVPFAISYGWFTLDRDILLRDCKVFRCRASL